MSFKVIAPLPCAKKRIRLKKLIDFKSSLNEKTYFFGWNRENNEIEYDDELYQRKFILSGGGYVNKKARLMYVIWFFSVLKLCLSFKKGDVVWVLGFESTLPALIVSKIKGFKVIFDDADRFSYLFNQNSKFIRIVRYFEYLASSVSLLHIIPCFERYEFKTKKMFILKNTPEKKEVQKAKEIDISENILNFRNRFEKVIYINGWLTKTRGMTQVLHLAKQKNIGLLIAGKSDSDYIDKLSFLENVLYVGELSSIDALSLYRVSDFVLTYYDPAIYINRFAESNKWGDAIEMNTPIIVNSEVVTAKFIKDNGCCISVPYNETKELIIQINNTNTFYLRERMAFLSNQIKCFEEQLRTLFSKVGI